MNQLSGRYYWAGETILGGFEHRKRCSKKLPVLLRR